MNIYSKSSRCIASALLAACLLTPLLLLTGCNGSATADPVPVAPNTPVPRDLSEAFEMLENAKAVIVIYNGNNIYDIRPLEKQTVVVDQGHDIVNEIDISENGMVMARSTCSNQDCVEQGEVTLGNYHNRILGEWIVCMPNQVSLRMIVKEDSAP